MDNQIILNNGVDVLTQNVTFTQAQWIDFVQKVNSEMALALFYGLIIGAIAGMAGMYLGQWYNGRKK